MRVLRRITRVAIPVVVPVVVLVAAAVVVPITAAGAHVTLHPGTFSRGASDVIVGLAVPNESTTASTVALEVDIPTGHPLLGVKAQQIAGWTAAVTTTKLAKPVTTDDGQITEAVSKVTWTAASGGGYGGEQFQLFQLLVGTLPSDVRRVALKVLQTYSDGSVVRWIEPVVKGVPAPEHPAPVLTLTGRAR